MVDALMIGVEPDSDDGVEPEAGAGELAVESFWKACRAGDFAAAWSAFQEMQAAAGDSASPMPEADGQPSFPG